MSIGKKIARLFVEFEEERLSSNEERRNKKPVRNPPNAPLSGTLREVGDESDIKELERLLSAPHSPQFEDGMAFEEIYTLAGVPPAPFSAEKLLKIFDTMLGVMLNMDVSVHQQAIHAMDSADDQWDIKGVIHDAQLKIEALHARAQELTGSLQQEELRLQQETRTLDEGYAALQEEVALKIAELQAQLEHGAETVQAEKDRLVTEMSATREAATTEINRLSDEVQNLQRVSQNFSENSSPSP